MTDKSTHVSHTQAITLTHTRSYAHTVQFWNSNYKLSKMTTQKCEQSICKDGMIRLISNAAFNRPHKMLIDDFGYALELPNFSMYYLADCQVLYKLRNLESPLHTTAKIPSRQPMRCIFYIFRNIRRRTLNLKIFSLIKKYFLLVFLKVNILI